MTEFRDISVFPATLRMVIFLSGLGLSVVDAVVKDHNGYLDLSSKTGHGTSFYPYFPVTREDTRDDGIRARTYRLL